MCHFLALSGRSVLPELSSHCYVGHFLVALPFGSCFGPNATAHNYSVRRSNTIMGLQACTPYTNIRVG